MKKISIFMVFAMVGMMFASCNVYNHSVKSPNTLVELTAADFELSEPVTGEATVTRIIGIDWERLFGTTKDGVVEEPSLVNIPVIGSFHLPSGADYAIFDMLQKNPGYDVVFYPQVESYRHAPVLGTDIYSTTTYKVTARLGKMKKK